MKLGATGGTFTPFSIKAIPMLNILISLLTFVLIIVSLFMVLVVLMQRANSNAGMGSAFGGGVAESAFGADTTNVLVRATKWSAVAFFVLALVLYLLFISRHDAAMKEQAIEGISGADIAAELGVAPEAAAPAATTAEATATAAEAAGDSESEAPAEQTAP